MLFGLVVAAVIFIKSSQGDRFLHFVKETRIELRKVVWPTREETIKTTGFVLIAVIIVAIFLWIVDAFFTWGVQLISRLNF
jgi:preprotein translocase subunit SecE